MLAIFYKIGLYGPPTAAAIWIAAVYCETYPIKTSSIRVSHQSPKAFQESDSMRELVNPRKSSSSGDSHEITVDVPNGVSDEQLLAWFLRGFYASYAFAPESLLLRCLGWKGPKLPGLDKTPAMPQIWHVAELSTSALPPLHSVLYGTWRVVDVQLADRSQRSTSSNAESSIDLAFRPYETFGGCKRFSVSRSNICSKRDQAHIRYDCIVCDPTGPSRPFHSGPLRTFHMIYAMVLFRSGINNVRRSLSSLESKSS